MTPRGDEGRQTEETGIEYIVRGRADSAEFARAERIAQMLEKSLPKLRATTEAFHPADWGLERPPCIVTTGGGVTVGGAREFEAAVKHKYGIEWNIDPGMAEGIARENMAEAESRRKDKMDVEQMAEEERAAQRQASKREWLTALATEMERVYLGMLQDVCIRLRTAKASAAPLAESCRVRGEEAEKKKKTEEAMYDTKQLEPDAQRPITPPPPTTPNGQSRPQTVATTPHQQQPPGTAGNGAQQLQQTSDAVLATTEPQEPQVISVEEAVSAMAKVACFGKVAGTCERLPLGRIADAANRIRDGFEKLPHVDPLWPPAPQWYTWSSVTASSLEYLQSHCSEAEDLRSKLLQQTADLVEQMRPRSLTLVPVLGAESMEALYSLAQQYVEALNECVSSAVRIYKTMIKETHALRKSL